MYAYFYITAFIYNAKENMNKFVSSDYHTKIDDFSS